MQQVSPVRRCRKDVPAEHVSILTILILLSGAATFAAMFGAALQVGPETVYKVPQQSGLFLRTLGIIWIAIPLFTALLIFGLGLAGTSATLLLLMSVCPGLPALLTLARIAHSSIETAFLALFLTAAIGPLLIPYWIRLLGKFLSMDLTVQPRHVLTVLLPTVFLPIVLGFLVRTIWFRTTPVLAAISDGIDLVGTVASVAILLFEGFPMLIHVPPAAFAAVVIITVGSAALAFWAARPNLAEQKAVFAAAALGNPALALVVVEVSYFEFQAPVLVSVYVVVRLIVMLPFLWWLRRMGGSRRWIGSG